jgi:hypothetical protein
MLCRKLHCHDVKFTCPAKDLTLWEAPSFDCLGGTKFLIENSFDIRKADSMLCPSILTFHVFLSWRLDFYIRNLDILFLSWSCTGKSKSHHQPLFLQKGWVLLTVCWKIWANFFVPNFVLVANICECHSGIDWSKSISWFCYSHSVHLPSSEQSPLETSVPHLDCNCFTHKRSLSMNLLLHFVNISDISF